MCKALFLALGCSTEKKEKVPMELIFRKQMKTKSKITSDGGVSVVKIMMEVI